MSSGTVWDRARPRAPRLAGVSGLEHPVAGPRGGTDRRRVCGRAAARLLDTDFHGQRLALCCAIFPAVPAGGPVRQADGGQRLGLDDRPFYDRTVGSGARNPHCCACRRSRHLRRRQPVRRVFRARAPMAEGLFRTAGLPNRLIPAAIALGTSTFTMSALPGTPAIQNAIPIPFFGTTPLAAPGLGIIAAAIMVSFGLWWLDRAGAAARNSGEGYGALDGTALDAAADDPV